MARLTIRERRKKRDRDVLIAVMCVMRTFNTVLQMYMLIREFIGQRIERSPHIPLNPNVYQQQIDSLNRLVHSDDTTCHDQLRVNRHTFMRLCNLLMQRGLQDSRDVCVAEKVAIFLWILSHHTKNRRTKFQFIRSGETISRHFNVVLLAILRLHDVLWFHPEPVLPNDPEDSRNLRFIYALSGWEGSATDSRVLANALVRPHGLKIPQGRFYLVDAGYTNGPGLLAPYRTQCRIVTACCLLLHNFIKREMSIDPVEHEYDMWELHNMHNVPLEDPEDHITQVDTTNEWTEMRDNLATQMYNEFLATHGDGQ
ncbi:hypothetical protein Acr_28g0005930 [Actinidia rufa]|uniref:DUF8040 domain-containing protein n=1 Tax=Actinidia rufa TaxID=165716 RepID=A0A7J0HA46_9ERIC|nr:hypothetical protein Acr_28g0005930 [Actinidia rufa]